MKMNNMNNSPIKVLVGSLNPVKINAVQSALSPLFPDQQVECLGLDAPSKVADQPMTATQTRLGAINRVKFCQQQQPADFYIAIEGGVDVFDYGAATFAYVVIANNTRQSIGRSANLPLPDVVYQALQQGEDLGHVMDRLFKTKNIKQKGGAIGLLTNGNATRQGTYCQALTLAMSPYLHAELYAQTND
jgi:inosine/xanthosine triphosphatase